MRRAPDHLTDVSHATHALSRSNQHIALPPEGQKVDAATAACVLTLQSRWTGRGGEITSN
jgi:hypothetical protein